MTYSTPKPLPEVPSSSVLRRLTVDSNALISTFIRRILDEERLDSSWIDVIKSTLGNFGEYLESGQIISGVKATQRAQNHARILADATAREHYSKQRERLRESKIGKGKGNDKDVEKESTDLDVSTILNRKDERLKEIHTLTSKVATPASENPLKYLLLTLSPPSDTPVEPEMDFEVIPASQACKFNADTFSLPFYNDHDGRHGQGGTVLCGLDNWISDSGARPQIVGGTFTFQNISSGTMYESLTAILRLSIYTYMSLIFEQRLLSNFHIMLQYPSPPVIPTSTPLIHAVTLTSPPTPTRKSRSNKQSSGIWSFLSKKTEGIIHRVTGANSDGSLHRTSSVDIVYSSSKPSWRAHDTFEESTKPERTLAETESASNTIKASPARVAEEEERRDRERFGPFMSTLRRIQDQNCILSASPKLIFPPPPLVARLAQREESQRYDGHLYSSSGSSLSHRGPSMPVSVPGFAQGPPTSRLTGVEKTGLGSILGWEGREARGRGMASVRSFVRHQGLVVLYAEHTQIGEEMHLCGRPRWVAFRYWSRRPAVDADRDQMLGEFVERLCDVAAMEKRCETEGCNQPRHRHHMSWTCGGLRVKATVKDNPSDNPDGGDAIEMWQTCGVCRKMTKQAKMNDGTYLFSFAKYLELLIWSPLISSLFLCEHITSPSPLSPQAGESPLSGSRFNILRHFAYKRRILTFALTAVHNDIYELRLPKLQIISGSMPKEEKIISDAKRKQEGEEERLTLGNQIDDWWQGIKVRLDKLDDFLEIEATQAIGNKDLPPLPASDDESSGDEATLSRSPSPLPIRPSASRSISLAQSTTDSLVSFLSESTRSKPAAPYPPGFPISIRQSRKLLRQLRLSFQKTESTLQRQVQDTPISSLNDVRRAFRLTARGTCKRLAAWQVKHVPGAPVDILKEMTLSEPEWWSVSCHAVPGGRVVVREGEWGSVIAFTLSSLDYQRELAFLNSAPGPASSPAGSVNSEAYSPRPDATIRPTKSTVKSPDPDENDTISWEESEPWSAVITRREHPRDVSSLLSLRDVLRTKPSFDNSSLTSRFSGSLSRGVANFTPPSAWAQPQVQVNLQAAGGRVSQFPDAVELAEKVLESQSHFHTHSPDGSSDSDYKFVDLDAEDVTPTPSGFVEKHARRGGASTIVSFDNTAESELGGLGAVPAIGAEPGVPVALPSSSQVQQDLPPSGIPFSGALSHAMRYFLGSGSPSRGPSPGPQGPHHGLLTRDPILSIDDRPHIKYDWTIGKRLKFSCTVYYAKQFDALRKRCGVDNVVIKSLERSENWTAVGGKSKSNFWKSSDDRFIIKTLVNAWNVADLQVLIELAPSYFRYIDSTANKASVLAKLMGFYTVEVKNLETGTVQAKHDLLVMENLFYDQKVTRTFDLKGIQTRRVKITSDGTQRRTLFDGEWIEGQQRAPLLIQPHCGHILHEAIKADADFLAKSNIMDYSLLLGIDEERREIACGLVDTIGSYTFAKTLEYKAKQNLNTGKGKEVTVIPPAEYHARFVNSIENYFWTCPDKWTKPPHFVDRTRASDLPSVV